MWSGRPNPALAAALENLVPSGAAVDVGCGEGADALWLAGRGWEVDGIDLSDIAVDRARAHAAEHGQSGERFHVADARGWARQHPAAYALVTGAFLHADDEGDRARLLRSAAEVVAPGGRLFLLSHATPPPWARQRAPGRTPTTPENDRHLAGAVAWSTERAEVRIRTATGPDGSEARLEDSILLLRRPR